MRRFVGRAPGRLDLMGGSAAFAGGLVVETTILEGVWVTLALREDRQIVIVNPQARNWDWGARAEFDLNDLTDDQRVRELVKEHPGMGWTAHILGAFFLLKEWFPELIVQGANIYIKSDAPVDAGVGSSAALEVAVMKTAACAFGIDLSGVDLAGACQWVETIIAESACGGVDQVTSVLGEERMLLPVLCQPCLPQSPIRLPDDLRLWAVVLGPASHGIQRESAHAAAYMAYKLICDWEGIAVEMDEASQISRWTDQRWNGYLANVTPSLFRSNYERRLPESLTGDEYLREGQIHVDPFTTVRPELRYRIRANARFVVEESQRARLFVGLMGASSGFEEMGELMYQSHYGYSECGLGCEAADYLVSLVCEEGAASGLFGAKITGNGGGGVVVVLGRSDAEFVFHRVLQRYAGFLGRRPQVLEGSSMGADRFGVLTLES